VVVVIVVIVVVVVVVVVLVVVHAVVARKFNFYLTKYHLMPVGSGSRQQLVVATSVTSC